MTTEAVPAVPQDHLEPSRFPTVARVRGELADAHERFGGDSRYTGWAEATAHALAFEVDMAQHENERLLERIRRAEGIAERAP